MNRCFRESFVGKAFKSAEQVECELRDFCSLFKVNFFLRSSTKQLERRWMYDKLQYACVRCKRCSSIGRGQRKIYTRSTNCPARIYFVRRGSSLFLSFYHLTHNHTIDSVLYDRHPSNRRLSDTEVEQCATLFQLATPSADLRRHIANRFGKRLTGQDIINIRRKVRPCYMNCLENVCCFLEKQGIVRVLYNDDKVITHICFASHQQISLFHKFYEVVSVDGTYGTNRENYTLYTFLVTDGMGRGRPICYAFILRENNQSLLQLFSLFRSIMGDGCQVATFVMDKMAAQRRAAQLTYGCDVLLCYFHVRQAIRKHTNSARTRYLFHRMATMDTLEEFNRDVGLIKRTDPAFANYLTAHWLSVKREWAVHAQDQVVHLGNVTNNRLQNANRHVKRLMNHRDGLLTAVQKAAEHASQVMNDMEMLAAYDCDRHILQPQVDELLSALLLRVKIHAGHILLKHHHPQQSPVIGDPKLPLKKVNSNERCRPFAVNILTLKCNCLFSQSMLLPCKHLLAYFKENRLSADSIPIHRRWLTSFNLPLVQLQPTLPINAETDNYRCHRQTVLRLLDNLHQTDPARCSSVAADMVRQLNEELHAVRSSPHVASTSAKQTSVVTQPRWSGLPIVHPCGICSKAVNTAAVQCTPDMLTFHCHCVGERLTCPYCQSVLTSLSEQSSCDTRQLPICQSNASTRLKTVQVRIWNGSAER